MKGKNIKSIIALLLIALMMVTLVGCGKSKADKFLSRMKKLANEFLDLAKKMDKNPEDEKLLERYLKLLGELADATEEAEEIEKEMSEEEKEKFEAKLKDVFSKLSEIDDGGS